MGVGGPLTTGVGIDDGFDDGQERIVPQGELLRTVQGRKGCIKCMLGTMICCYILALFFMVAGYFHADKLKDPKYCGKTGKDDL